MTARVFDDRSCVLGEGPLWHPLRKQLYWFNILDKKLLTRDSVSPREWTFEETVSAAGWVDVNTVLMASAKGLWRLDLTDGNRTLVVSLEAENALTRSNDGRADPWGGFWIGTMGYNAEPRAGAIYRYYRGELRKLFPGITISNAICFAPDRSCAYFTDTPTRKVMKVPLDGDGWPDGAPTVLLDLTEEGLNPDGAVVDADGNLWLAQWGAARIAVYGSRGQFLKALDVPAAQVTCPAFGGSDLTTLYVTSATEGLDAKAFDAMPNQGQTFEITGVAKGLPEPRVIL